DSRAGAGAVVCDGLSFEGPDGLRALRNPTQLSMDHPVTPRDPPPTSKEKNAVQREVTRLLEELAPERAPAHASRQIVPIQQHRTPNGCILQAATAALSVTWYA